MIGFYAVDVSTSPPLEPALVIEFNGVADGWVYRGSDLAEAGYTVTPQRTIERQP